MELLQELRDWFKSVETNTAGGLRMFTEADDGADKPEKKEMYDSVNNPKHYMGMGLECIDAIRAALTAEEFRGYCKGAALKYIWREGKKNENGDEDIEKAIAYLTFLFRG